jgi:acid stress-induced BolA-like protein IbaG/YrbA
VESDEIRQMIESGMPGATVRVEGDGTHFQALVVSETFAGKTPLQRHRQVYGCLGNKLGREIHALSIQALTAGEWGSRRELDVTG